MKLVNPVYRTILPSNKSSDFLSQWTYCFEEFRNIIKETCYIPFRVNIFISHEDNVSYDRKHYMIHNSFYNHFGNEYPPYGIIAQSPEEPFKVIMEIGLISDTSAIVKYINIDNQICCQIELNGYSEFWMIGVKPLLFSPCMPQSTESAFERLQSIFCTLGIGFSQIVRQWNYIEGILNHEHFDGQTKQNYQMFNEVRYNYYKNYRDTVGFPAATGIGMSDQALHLDAFAISDNDNLHIQTISNPNQFDSYQYGQEVLRKHSDELNNEHLQAPQFERAKLLFTQQSSRLLISGTASIIGQDTVGIGDVEKQTEVTIENIEILSSKSNLVKCAPGLNIFPDKYSYLRVYVKEKNDIPKIKSICDDYFGDVPTTYVQADICRDNLLVEIEGEKIN
jgi:hypothetical protein